MVRDPATEKTSKTEVATELGSELTGNSSEKGPTMPDEFKKPDALPIRGDLAEASQTEVLLDIADHVLIRCIGRGAYGEVWLGRNAVGTLHAVKVVKRGRFSDDHPFHREFEGLRKFYPISGTHPGFVHILHVGERFAQGYFYYVMELADDVRTGSSIVPSAYVARTLTQELPLPPQRLPLETSLPLGLALASALAELHAHKFIHRDIKPSNIIFVKGEPKFADIGLLTNAGKDVSAYGTLNYMPPDGPGEATGDIFSLGKVFYQLFMGQPVKSFPELPGAAEEFTTNPALQQLNQLILKACHVDPSRRFQTANELYEALVSVTETVQGKRPRTGAGAAGIGTGTKTPSGEQRPKVRWSRMAALLVLLLAITGGMFLALRPPQYRGTGTLTRPAPVVVLMDTTAKDGTYDDDNKRIGASNAKEVSIALEAESVAVTSRSEPLYAGWDNETDVISMNPDLVIVHRSSFHHSYNAVFDLGRTNNGFAHPTEDPKWLFLYNQVGDDKLIILLGCIGNEVPRTKFLVYSRGTDTNWLSVDFRIRWVRKIEERFPKLKDRISTMVIPNGYKGSFRQPETRKLLRTNVVQILRLPDKREPAGKANGQESQKP